MAGSNTRVFGPLETPLTLAAQLDDPVEMIKALRNGGAHLDFRAKDGMTALHKAARTRNLLALKVTQGPSHTGTPPRLTPCVLPHNSHPRVTPKLGSHWSLEVQADHKKSSFPSLSAKGLVFSGQTHCLPRKVGLS